LQYYDKTDKLNLLIELTDDHLIIQFKLKILFIKMRNNNFE